MGERPVGSRLRAILPKCFARGDSAPSVESLLVPLSCAGLPAAALSVPRHAEFDETDAAEHGLIPVLALVERFDIEPYSDFSAK